MQENTLNNLMWNSMAYAGYSTFVSDASTFNVLFSYGCVQAAFKPMMQRLEQRIGPTSTDVIAHLVLPLVTSLVSQRLSDRALTLVEAYAIVGLRMGIPAACYAVAKAFPHFFTQNCTSVQPTTRSFNLLFCSAQRLFQAPAA